MGSITIRNLDDRTKARLRVRAAHHRRSMEAEARTIIRDALATEAPVASNLADAIRVRLHSLGGIELPLAPRELRH